MDKKKLETWIINISNTSYKFTKATVLSADKAIGHIKKNPRLYKYIVGFIALCLMPAFIEFGRDFVFELIMALANAPTNIATEYILMLMIYFAKAVCIVGIAYNLARASFNFLVEHLKK